MQEVQARAVIAASSEQNGISKILIANRSLKKAEELAEIGASLGLKCNAMICIVFKELAIRITFDC